MLPPVVKTIMVPCAPERAFAIFTRDFAAWWPGDKHSTSAMAGKAAQSVNADARAGGEIWEIDHAGTRVLWGSFTAFSPSSHLSIAWHIARPSSEATTVDVAFTAEGEGTKVTLTHSGWEAFGEQAETMRNGYNSGWVHVFEEKFKAACL